MARIDVFHYENVTDPRLNRHVEHDERSKAYRVDSSGVQVQSVKHDRKVPIFDQGQLGSCTGNAGIGCLGTEAYYDDVKDKVVQAGFAFDENGCIKLYSQATQVDSVPGAYPPNDTGSSGLAIAKVLKKAGLISGYQHAMSLDDVLAALQSNPVIAGVNWYNNFFNPDNNGVISVGSRDYVAGGHEFVLDEVDTDKQLIGATNSWSTQWGLNGRFYIPFDLMDRLLSERGDVTVFVPVTKPAPQPSPQPKPTPTPQPTPTPENADRALWNQVQKWAQKKGLA